MVAQASVVLGIEVAVLLEEIGDRRDVRRGGPRPTAER
jgi:hypothetical protein